MIANIKSVEMIIAKKGDLIEWTFEKDHSFLKFSGQKYRARVVFFDEKTGCYAVYAPYGQDFIPFEKAVIVESIKERIEK